MVGLVDADLPGSWENFGSKNCQPIFEAKTRYLPSVEFLGEDRKLQILHVYGTISRTDTCSFLSIVTIGLLKT